MESWRQFVSSINRSTPISDVWKKIKKISGKSSIQKITSLDVNGITVTDDKHIADILSDTYASHFNNNNYDNAFITKKVTQ